MDPERARQLEYLEQLLPGRAELERAADMRTDAGLEEVGGGGVHGNADELLDLRVERLRAPWNSGELDERGEELGVLVEQRLPGRAPVPGRVDEALAELLGHTVSSQRAISVWSAPSGSASAACSQIATDASPSTNGAPVAWASAFAVWMSLTINRIANPDVKKRGSTNCGTLCSVAQLRPVESLIASTITFASSPKRVPGHHRLERDQEVRRREQVVQSLQRVPGADRAGADDLRPDRLEDRAARLEIRLGTTDHDRQRPGLRSDDPAGDRRVDVANAAPLGLDGDFARLGRVRRTHVDEQGAGLDRIEQTLVEHDLPNDCGGGEHENDRLRPGGRLGERPHGGPADAGTGVGIDVEALHLVPGGNEPGGHRHAHMPEPDEADSDAFGVTTSPLTNLDSFAVGFVLGFVSHVCASSSALSATRKASNPAGIPQ